MKNGPLFLLGLLLAIALSWGFIVLGSHAQLGSLAPYYDDGEGQSFPLRPAGIAMRGQLVYADLGCAACHTQQVRRPGYGSDQERGWGERQSVARDYIFQLRPQLGTMRIGPDLTNLAGRKPTPMDAEDLMKLLYVGSPTHPSYAFLFQNRKIVGQRADVALKLTGSNAPAAGHEIVPTERAQSLVAYLLGLNTGYDYPESKPVEPAAPKGKEAKPAAAAPAAAQPAGANKEAPPPAKAAEVPGKRPEVPSQSAPADEKKKLEGKK